MDKYLEAEKRLAELLGWKWYGWQTNRDGPMWHHGETNKWRTRLPQWARSSAAAFELMCEHRCYPDEEFGFGDVIVYYPASDDEEFRYVATNIGLHADKSAAVRYAIVLAVIEKLTNLEK